MALFIGGRADGRRMNVDKGVRYIRLPYHRPLRAFEITGKEPVEETLIMNIENYVQTFDGVFVHEELECRDVIQLLVRGYRNEGGK